MEWNVKGLQEFLDTTKGGTIYAPASLGNTTSQNVVIAQGAELSKDTNDTSFSIHGGICKKDTDEANGASLELFGQDFEAMAGYFVLIAKNKSARCQLLGTPSGNLLWNDNEIVTSQHEITSNRVLRLNNGWQICIDHNGSFSAGQNATQFTWNYQVPFVSNPFVFVNTVCMNSNNFKAKTEIVDNNRTVGYIFNTGTPANIEVYFLAIGRWK